MLVVSGYDYLPVALLCTGWSLRWKKEIRNSCITRLVAVLYSTLWLTPLGVEKDVCLCPAHFLNRAHVQFGVITMNPEPYKKKEKQKKEHTA